MRIEGSRTFTAAKSMLWPLLHDTAMLSQAIPGCESFDQVNPSEFTGALTIKKGPLSGEYKGTVQIKDAVYEESFSLSMEGSGPEGSFWAEGQITLEEMNGNTTLIYNGEIVASGSTVTASPRLLQTTANSLIRQFLNEIEHYIQIQTATYTTQTPSRPIDARRSSIDDVRDKIKEIQQNRRTTTIVILLFILATFMTIGATFIAIFLIRFGFRLFRRYIKQVVDEERQYQAQSQTA